MQIPCQSENTTLIGFATKCLERAAQNGAFLHSIAQNGAYFIPQVSAYNLLGVYLMVHLLSFCVLNSLNTPPFIPPQAGGMRLSYIINKCLARKPFR